MKKDSRKIGDVIDIRIRIEKAEHGCGGCVFFEAPEISCPYFKLKKILGGPCRVGDTHIIYKLIDEGDIE